MQQNSNKRIAIVIDSLAGGGAEKVMLTLAKGLLAQGHQPHIIVLLEHEVPAEILLHFCFDAHERYLSLLAKD